MQKTFTKQARGAFREGRGVMLKYQMPWPTGGTVDVYLASDADSAIAEARKEGFMEGRADALTANEFRKQGAQEERSAILRVIDGPGFANADDGDRATGYREGRNRCIAYIKARGAGPVCTCAWVGEHHPDCPCYKPPEPAPLENYNPKQPGSYLDTTVNALVDRVNAQGIEIAKLRGRP